MTKIPSVKVQSLLHEAAYCGHLEICQLILDNVQDQNFLRDLDGRTHLENAAQNGHLEICKLLMSCVEVENQSSVARDTFNRVKGLYRNTREDTEVHQYLQTYFENSEPLNEAGPAKRFKSL